MDLEAKLQQQSEKQKELLEVKLQQHFQEAIKQLTEVLMSFAVHINRLKQTCIPSSRCNYVLYDDNDRLTGKKT